MKKKQENSRFTLNILLAVILGICVVLLMRQQEPGVSQGDANVGGDDLLASMQFDERTYPEQFGQEEKLVLIPQTAEVPNDEHYLWDETVRAIASDADGIVIKKSGEDCFGEPVVLKTARGEDISVTNGDEEELTIGMNDQSWTIQPGETITINPEFPVKESMTLQANAYGYGCGPVEAPSGLFLVE